MLKRFLTLTILLCGLSFAWLARPLVLQANNSPLTEDLDPQFVIDWMNLFYLKVQAERINAPNSARFYAYAGITAYESLLPGMPFNNSLAGQIPHMPDMPFPTEEGVYDWLSTFNGAFSTMSKGIFLNAQPETYQAIEDLRRSQLTARREVVGDEVANRSFTYGVEIGKAILAWMAEDGYAATRSLTWDIPVGDSMWEITTADTRPMEPFWGQIRPFILDYADACAVYDNVPYSTDDTSTFYQQALEVVEVNRNLTDEQEETARFWLDNPGRTGAPAGHWMSIANQLVERLDLPLSRAAEMYAMVGIAVGDSFISAWSLKYQMNLLRPVTYIRANIRGSWSPYIESPPFPEYPSGHSVVSTAAAEVLTQMFGAVDFIDKTHLIYGHEEGLVRTFYSFEHASNEAAISRLYGGIHYRAAIEGGIRQGRCVGAYAMSHIRLNPVLQGE